MSVLFFWRGDNYRRDMRFFGKSYDLNQNNDLISDLRSGEHIWAFTRRLDKTYVLCLDLIIISVKRTRPSDPDYRYGKYHAAGDMKRSRYFDVKSGPDVEPLIRSLSFAPKAHILGHSFQGRNGVRLLTAADEKALIDFSSKLPTI